ncbi:MAG: hypothetical protein E6R13_02450 [Spirochaetes bacterium]|nr:MAG: hypothetical protein E6R13_02450 [Spirochaetota bacterium]
MSAVELVLPTKKVAASRKNPKRLIIYSKPKVGKTTALAGLDNCLILDMENGSDFTDALKVKINNLSDLKAYGTKIIEAGKPYKYIAVDTVTAMEDMVKPLALKLYRDTPMGRSFTGDNILTLPNGAGYGYLREAFFNVLDYIDTLADNIILLGHLKDRQIEIKGKEVNAADVDLTGKIKSLICANADAIAYMTREDNNKTVLNFQTSDTIICGARPEHLKNQQIVISEIQEDGTLKTNWDKIYIE